METPLAIDILISGIASLAGLSSLLLLFRLHWPAPVSWVVKVHISALSPFLVLVGVATTVLGYTTGSLIIALIGLFNVLMFCAHIFVVTRPPEPESGFENAFGLNWNLCIRSEQRDYLLPRRMSFRLPSVLEPRFKQDISFATLPGTTRELLWDVWQPHATIAPSGLALIYLHGSAWYLLDKDVGTRPFFRHLAAQGHVIIDVAYRLAPETDMMGMINDVKRAVAWIKENATTYGVNPNLIVVGGGSAGAHLALLAAYTANNSEFTPTDLKTNVNVSGVISLYGPSDLEALYYHTNQHLTLPATPGRLKKIEKAIPTKMPEWIAMKMRKHYHRLRIDKVSEETGALDALLGGNPDERPDVYKHFSPVSHIHADCPPTLLIHGEHDVMAPAESTRLLCERLEENKVPTVMHILPQTDHAFDLVLPQISPSAHNAIYDVERFLAMLVTKATLDKERILVTSR